MHNTRVTGKFRRKFRKIRGVRRTVLVKKSRGREIIRMVNPRR